MKGFTILQLFNLLVIAISCFLAASASVIENIPVSRSTQDLVSSAKTHLEVMKKQAHYIVKERVSLRGRELQADNIVVQSIRTIQQVTDTFRAVLDQDFDFTVLERATDLAAEQSGLFFMVSGEEGVQLTTDLAIAGQQLAITEIYIRTLAQTIIGNAENIHAIFSVVEADAEPGSTVEGLNIGASIVGLNILSTALETFETDSRRALQAFEELGNTTSRLHTQSVKISDQFMEASKENSALLQSAAYSLRDQAYGICGGICGGTCLATITIILIQPYICGGCIAACFTPAAVLVETQQIPALQRQLEDVSGILDEFSNTFQTFAEVSTALGTRATQDIELLESVRSDFDAAAVSIRETGANVNPILLTTVSVVRVILDSVTKIENAANKILETFVSEEVGERRLSTATSMTVALEHNMIQNSILTNSVSFKVEQAYWEAMKNAHISKEMVEQINDHGNREN